MRCKKPIKANFTTVGCGQCMNCRINKQREITARLVLEQRTSHNAFFVTMTIAPEHEKQISNGLLTLQPDLLRRFLVSQRTRNPGGMFRYFAVGEYGDETERPHFHACVFVDQSFRFADFMDGWRYGFMTVAPMNNERAAYTAGYTTKKMTSDIDERLYGRHPEFAIWSRKALGTQAAHRLHQWYHTASGAEYLARYGDISTQVRIDGQIYPLARVLADKMRRWLDIPLTAKERALVNDVQLAKQLDREAAARDDVPEIDVSRQTNAWTKKAWRRQKARQANRV